MAATRSIAAAGFALGALGALYIVRSRSRRASTESKAFEAPLIDTAALPAAVASGAESPTGRVVSVEKVPGAAREWTFRTSVGDQPAPEELAPPQHEEPERADDDNDDDAGSEPAQDPPGFAQPVDIPDSSKQVMSMWLRAARERLSARSRSQCSAP